MAAYNLKLMQTHLDALCLGFCSGEPFHVRDIGVHPLHRWEKIYSLDVLHGLHLELGLRPNQPLTRQVATDKQQTMQGREDELQVAR